MSSGSRLWPPDRTLASSPKLPEQRERLGQRLRSVVVEGRGDHRSTSFRVIGEQEPDQRRRPRPRRRIQKAGCREQRRRRPRRAAPRRRQRAARSGRGARARVRSAGDAAAAAAGGAPGSAPASPARARIASVKRSKHLVGHVLDHAAAELGQDAGDVHLGDDADLGLAAGRAPRGGCSSACRRRPGRWCPGREATISAVRARGIQRSNRTLPR